MRSRSSVRLGFGICVLAVLSFALPEAGAAGGKALPTLWLIGDSTVRNGQDTGNNGQWGWGNPIAHYFDKAKITVKNKALGGTSSRGDVARAGAFCAGRRRVASADGIVV